MGKILEEISDCSNFICFLFLFFIGTGAVVYHLVVKKPQWAPEPIDLAIGGFIACGVVGLVFFLKSLKSRKESA